MDLAGLASWLWYWASGLGPPLALLVLARWVGEWLALDMDLGPVAPIPPLVALLVSLQLTRHLIGG
ncbi:hypothetical protein Ocepr_2357 (plasmid) [Oceanithermus profundus DSM 14977]|uniref:Uncharacterized protein n=1 Tax=Oceanithermus profundus (strain DSM 14977 / NBRC 100410 / VKM B-2274 / 506) TaxID=670487 RepID=E4UAM6_OCEP5|nr:hypothetical protein [Oceanithermus profundus]ADR37805.1 hypothetical protein Ocepr_2357 [Oceanithermus profundus DSM 14977]